MIKKTPLRTAVILAAIVPYFLWIFGIGIKVHLGVYTYAPVQLAYAALLIAVLTLIHGKNAYKTMGIDKGFGKGFLFALICTLPMFITSALISPIDTARFSSIYRLIILLNLTLFAGFFEEYFIRGFLFGQLFRYCRWGYIPAMLLQALLFGLAHLYQGYDLLSSLSVFLVTALGAVFFSWVYVESGCNLWCSIFLHGLMNLSWLMFSADHYGAVGNVPGMIARLVTVLVAVLWIVWYKRKNHIPFVFNKKNCWIEPQTPTDGQ